MADMAADPAAQKQQRVRQIRKRSTHNDDQYTTPHLYASHTHTSNAPTTLQHRSGAPDDETRAAIVARLEPHIQERVAAAMASDAVQQRIQRRLLEERARLEARVTAQIDAERQALLEQRRRERQQHRPQEPAPPLDLDRILEENRRKLEEARGRGGGGVVQAQVRGGTARSVRTMHSNTSVNRACEYLTTRSPCWGCSGPFVAIDYR